jgi:hypothetical protein
MGGLGMRELVIVVIALVVIIWPWARIVSKAGYSPWLALVFLVPFVNLIALWIFAYSSWPALNAKSGG